MSPLVSVDLDSYLQLHAAYVELRRLGWAHDGVKWTAPEADPVVSKAVAKELVTDEKGFAVSEGQVFINNAFITKAEDTLRYSHNGMFGHDKDGQLFINKNIIGNEGHLYAELARADDTLRAGIEALQTQVNQHRDAGNQNLEEDERRYEEQQAWNKRHNQRLNNIEDAVQSAFEPKSKGRLDVTTQLEAAILRGFRKGLLKELNPGGLLHPY